MAAETPNDDTVRFAIGDQEYELPDPLTLTIDEWGVAWDYGEFVLEDFAPLADAAPIPPSSLVIEKSDTQEEKERKAREMAVWEKQHPDGPDEAARKRRLKNPAMMQSLFHIGYQRANPDQDSQTIKALIGGSKMLGLLESMAGDEAEDDAVNPTLTTEPERSSERSSDDSKQDSWPGSSKNSETPDAEPVPTGISE